ncbi:DNA primase [Brevibacillus choshinensis]|uniref:DNA primase n=1 Tax=Brevibacillus choshinensis TaxID=54911 RepID=A0ABX7FHC7_BRECH|nr:DNA primase [Brevibacillus choshinensis]QRG65613.1 DNA primase [Brevibacillus choshinensis]
MGLQWLKYLRDEVGNDEGIEEIEVKIEYEDGTKKKWIFVGDNEPIFEDGEDEEDEEDEDESSEDEGLEDEDQ